MTTRLVLFVLASSILLRLIFAANPSRSDEVRTGYELCREVEEQLILSVEDGLLTPQEAQQTVDRCFSLFAS